MTWNEYDSRAFAWLQERASNLYSQNGEDGVLAAIFERIGTANRWCCECGAADGLFFSNTRRLIEAGWSSVQIEADAAAYEKLAERYATHERVLCFHGKVEPSGPNSFDDILSRLKIPADLDLLVIDVDGQDYHLFNSLWKYKPRVVVCEFAPDADEMFIPEIGGEGQAGRKAILFVGDARGYKPVAQTRYNLLFVRDDLVHLVADPVEGVPANPNIKVGAVMSTPRLGFLTNSDVVYRTCYELGFALTRGEGVWWHHSLTRCIENHLQNGVDYVLAIDYDSIFDPADAARIVCHLHDNLDVDAVAAIQMKREGGEPLVTSDGEVTLTNSLVPMTQAHFGLTMFRRSVFERLPKPWFLEAPNPAGTWGEDRVDPDIHFWKQCREAGMKLMAATDVVIGHLEYVATWPGQDFKPIYQPLNDWRATGKPPAAFRKPQLAQAANMVMK